MSPVILVKTARMIREAFFGLRELFVRIRTLIGVIQNPLTESLREETRLDTPGANQR